MPELTEKGRRWAALPEAERHTETLERLARGMSEPMNEDDRAAIRWAVDQLDTRKRLARAVLLFHAAPCWDEKEKREWSELTGNRDATTRVLCDLAREIATTT